MPTVTVELVDVGVLTTELAVKDCGTGGGAVSYTHLTLPTNREV